MRLIGTLMTTPWREVSMVVFKNFGKKLESKSPPS